MSDNETIDMYKSAIKNLINLRIAIGPDEFIEYGYAVQLAQYRQALKELEDKMEIKEITEQSQEQSVNKWLEMDDAEVGEIVKGLMKACLPVDADDKSVWAACSMILCSLAHDHNATDGVFDIEDLEYAGNTIGSWQITVKKVG